VKAELSIAAADFSDEQIGALLDKRSLRLLLQHDQDCPGSATDFYRGVNDAVAIYRRERRAPTSSTMYKEIARLYRAAEKYDIRATTTALSSLSIETRAFLERRALQASLNLPKMDADLQNADCEDIARCCRLGSKWGESEKSRGGKRALTHGVALWAPEPLKGRPKLEAEFNLVVWLRIAWLAGMGVPPAETATPESRRKDGAHVGPFVRFVSNCLLLMDARQVDAVELINSVEHSRKAVDSRRHRDETTGR
jgi:hypothetical protein